MADNWMRELAKHYERTRRCNPDNNILILFDIDGTILDMRHMIRFVLRTYDNHHGTSLFDRLSLEDITVHENHIESFLETVDMPPDRRAGVLRWYYEHRWSAFAIFESHRPYRGVMEVIRWFQIQPRTFVGLNTGRPESMREDTLRSLNELGREYKVKFEGELLHMEGSGGVTAIPNTKVEGIHRFRKQGFTVCAFIDNEPENLRAVALAFPGGEILLLHADTLFESKRKLLPERTVKGTEYDITELVDREALPRHIQFVWHGSGVRQGIHHFLSSNVHWIEADIRMHPDKNRIIVRRHSLREEPLQEGEEIVFLDNLMDDARAQGKSLKFDLKEGGALVHRLLELLSSGAWKENEPWINAKLEDLTEQDFRQIAASFPSAILQVPVDRISSLILSLPQKARDILSLYTSWGINRFSVNWQNSKMSLLYDRLRSWGYEVNIYNVPDLESFLKAVLMMPTSITSDFNLSDWNHAKDNS